MTVQSRIEAILAPLAIEVGFSATHLPSGATVAINPDRLFSTASVYKIPIMVEVYRQVDAGRLRLSDRLPMPDSQRVIGSGVLQKLDAGLAPTIRDLVMLMIIISDNTATHMLQELVGGDATTATMRQLGIDDIHISLTLPQMFAHGYALPLDPVPDYAAMQEVMRTKAMDYDSLTFAPSSSSTTCSAAAMARLCAMIHQGTAASPASCADMMTILRAQQLRDRVPRFLPTGAVANKTGTFRGIRNDAGLLLRGATDVVSFGLFTFDRTAFPAGNTRAIATRNAQVNDAMAEIGEVLWLQLGT